MNCSFYHHGKQLVRLEAIAFATLIRELGHFLLPWIAAKRILQRLLSQPPPPPPQSSPVSKCHLPRTPQTGHISPASGQSRARTLHSSNGTLGIQTQPQEVINWLPLPHKPWQLAVMEMDLVVIRCVEGNGFQGKAAGSEQLAVGSPILHQPQMGLAPILLSASPLRHHKPAHLSYRGSQSWASTPQ
jgi:hypothetical protein